MQRSPREPVTVKLSRYLTDDMAKPNLGFRSALERSVVFRSLVKLLAVFGVCMVIAGEPKKFRDLFTFALDGGLTIDAIDGVLTPAQSVLGAIQGPRVAVPDITISNIVGISYAILIFLFSL